jgi:hypothetical protein
MANADDTYAGNEDINGAAIGDDADDAVNLAIGALTSQSDLDRQTVTRIASVPPAILSRRRDWSGLTPAQEEERLSRKRQLQAFAEAEYEHEREEISERADRLMTELDEQERACRKKLAEADARAIVLTDGRRVLVGNRGEYIDEATGDTLQGKDKADAQRQCTADSETVAEKKKLTAELAQNEEAREHLRKAQAISQTDSKNLSPEEMKEKETEARNELAIAEEKAKGVAYVDTEAATDTLTALGIGSSANSRTTSFASTMDGKEKISSPLQNEFSACALGAGENGDSPEPACPPSGNVNKKPTLQQNQ